MRIRHRRLGQFSAALLALALAAGACGGDKKSGGGDGSASGEPVEGGELRYGLEAETSETTFIEPATQAATPEESLASSQAVRLATLHLDEMGDKYGAIFAKRFVDGYTETEIASDLQLNVATVKTRAFRARSHVRSKLATAFAIAA